MSALERDGSVTRPTTAPVGKALPTRLAPLGRGRLAKATAAVRSVEQRMLADLDEQAQVETRRPLRTLVHALAPAERPSPESRTQT